MASSNAEVSSQALRGLQDNLNSLSHQIKEICDTMNSDQMRVGEAWRDSKFQEFKQGFQPQINRCEEISVHYKDWCVKVLEPAIEKVEKIETADVGGGGSSAIGGGGSAVGGGVAAASAAARTASIASGFKGGSTRKVVSRPSAKELKEIERQKKEEKKEIERIKKEGPQSAEEACKVDMPGSKPVIKSPNDPTAQQLHIKKSSSSGGWNANVKVGYETPQTPYGSASADIGGGYESGKDSTTSERTIYYDCVPDKEDA